MCEFIFKLQQRTLPEAAASGRRSIGAAAASRSSGEQRVQRALQRDELAPQGQLAGKGIPQAREQGCRQQQEDE